MKKVLFSMIALMSMVMIFTGCEKKNMNSLNYEMTLQITQQASQQIDLVVDGSTIAADKAFVSTIKKSGTDFTLDSYTREVNIQFKPKADAKMIEDRWWYGFQVFVEGDYNGTAIDKKDVEKAFQLEKSADRKDQTDFCTNASGIYTLKFEVKDNKLTYTLTKK